MSIIVKNASTLAEVFEAAAKIRTTWNPKRNKDEEDLWYRGQTRREFKLQPGLYRSANIGHNHDEYTTMTMFKHLGDHHLSRSLLSSWDWYFLAQHYRLPTRLLDWTESLLTGLYFALANTMETLSRQAFDNLLKKENSAKVFDKKSPTLWILDAGSLNNWANKEDALYSPDNPVIGDYCWDEFHNSKEKGSTVKPIAISPPHQNPRIVAQRGMFTVHGKNKDSIDDIAMGIDRKGLIKLGCVVLDQSNLASIWDELEVAGVGKLTLFPELDSVADHIKRVYLS